jgi:hypothetical protein
MKKSLWFLITICSLALLSSCGGGSSGQSLGVVTHFTVTSASASPTIGTPFNITVTALDAAGQTVASYSGTVHFNSSNGQPVQPASAMVTNGTGTFSITLNTAGSQSITATDTNSITGTSTSITVTGIPNPVPLVYQPLSPAAVAASSPQGVRPPNRLN